MPTDDETNEYLFEPHPLPAGERSLGRFRLLHELGAGGMATLYLAQDEVGCLVAIKRLHPHLAADRRFVEMFGDEAAIAARITHPNVCRGYELEQEAGHLFIPMEYVHGESLAALLRQVSAAGQQLPCEVALHLIGQACLGLQAAHELTDAEGHPLEVVHRDISPHNLLVTYEGEVKLVDFGIAAAVAKVHHTQTGTLKGKLGYMAPEQLRSSAVDRRADLFALGVVLYETVCGQRCFPGDGLAAAVRRIERVELTPPREHRPDLPRAVEQIILRALQPHPADRYPSAAEMYREVYAFLAGSSAPVNTRAVGELMQRIFARRYALREELRALAFAAPEVLEQEQLVPLTEVVTFAARAPGQEGDRRCEFCGAPQPDEAELARHQGSCSQRAWWLHNFGDAPRLETVGDARALRRRLTPAAPEPPPPSLWQRIRQGLGRRREQPDPLQARLRSIAARLGGVRDHGAAQLAGRGLDALWGMVTEIAQKSAAQSDLLGRIKPRLLRSANVLLAMTLEIEANAAYLAAGSDRELLDQIELLQARAKRAASEAIGQEIERSIRRKRALIAERERLGRLDELLRLRLESMVDAIELTHARVLQVAASPAMRELEADTQITVFLDSMLQEVELLGEAIQELREEG